jgi:hypothetical protein
MSWTPPLKRSNNEPHPSRWGLFQQHRPIAARDHLVGAPAWIDSALTVCGMLTCGAAGRALTANLHSHPHIVRWESET